MTVDIPTRRLAIVSLVIISALLIIGSLLANVLYQLRLDRAIDVANVQIAEVLHEGLAESTVAQAASTQYSAGRLNYRDIIERCERVSISEDQPAENLRVIDQMACELEQWGMPQLDVYVIETDGYNPGIRFLLGIENQSTVRVIKIISQHESADFGAILLSTESGWLKQLVDQTKNYYLAPPSASEVDIISGATITANALRNAIAEALKIKLEKSDSDEQ